MRTRLDTVFAKLRADSPLRPVTRTSSSPRPPAAALRTALSLRLTAQDTGEKDYHDADHWASGHAKGLTRSHLQFAASWLFPRAYVTDGVHLVDDAAMLARQADIADAAGVPNASMSHESYLVANATARWSAGQSLPMASLAGRGVGGTVARSGWRPRHLGGASPRWRRLALTVPRWPALVRYVDDGSLPIDNNPVEHSIRPVAVGCKNWLFAGSKAASERAATIMMGVAERMSSTS